ncbi:hypothetical protein EMIHUDRAFT_234590 [Emiliania huxleyi CCMP1516]|uniref:Uncharacterized protein n=2 Tax=Emiliania huxleyi TaxID=2903 RepID=A0A0D3JZ30_EMIH1|nr:hypothetical protein EMIHUDRAFT_234590 [Emiliania huxleyi CCMP1516]EOD28765.1 hypothetical protein EMIHUDRAFT_234590 [Emiliania huxleyi CCMP1516]|eukprot:XP_005781194.1 hypothetical protein EMIHUDRAFT_234590 [Emiliania huxleyi CCMP1516]
MRRSDRGAVGITGAVGFGLLAGFGLRVVHSKHEGSGHQDHGIFDPGVVRREGFYNKTPSHNTGHGTGAREVAASRPTIAPDEDIAALLERAQVSAPISDKVVPQLLAQDVGSVSAPLEAGSSAVAGGDGAAGERAGGGVGTGAAEGAAAEGGIGGGTEVSSLDPLVPALPTSGDGTIDAAREDEEEWAAAAAAYRQVCPVRREVAVFEEYRRQAAAEGRAAAEAAAEAEMEEEEPETGSGEAAALAAPLRGLASAPGCAGTTDRVTSFSDTLRPACSATTASSSSSAAFIHAYRPPDPLSVGPCGVICARGYATIWPAGYDEPCLLDGAAIRLLASAMATVRAYEDIEARRGRDGGDVRDVRCCRDVRSWAEVCAAAREREFKILARDSGGHRDWEEDPLGFDTNPMLLRAMCMAFE